MPPPCNGCRRVLRRAALLHRVLRGPAGYERCDAGLRACSFLRAAPHVRVTDPWHARGGGLRAWRRGWELVVRGACSVEESVRWGLWGIRLGGWAVGRGCGKEGREEVRYGFWKHVMAWV